MITTNLNTGLFTRECKIQFDALKHRTLDCRDLVGIFKLHREALSVLRDNIIKWYSLKAIPEIHAGFLRDCNHIKSQALICEDFENMMILYYDLSIGLIKLAKELP